MFNSCLFLAYGTEAIAVAYTVSAIVSVVASAASAVVSYRQQKEAAKQAEMNAEAQAKALAMEQQRKAAELAENQRRLTQQQRRERAAQFAALANTGFVATTGTPLEIMADTIQAQHRDLADLTGDGDLDQWKLGYQGQSLLQEARSRASLMRQQAGASLITGLAGAASDAASLSAKAGQSTGKTTGSQTQTKSGKTLLNSGSQAPAASNSFFRSTDYRGSRSY